jgi:NADP-dependent 3-hydroxy acid dehydrogenase YdfG
MRRSLNGVASVVTGASSGIGRAIAHALAAEGARLGLVLRTEAAMQQAVDGWPSGAPEPVPLLANLADDDAIEAAVSGIGARLGAVGVLVHSAGTIALGPFLELPVQSLDQQYRLNVRAPFLLTQRLLPALIATKGQIVFVNSSAGLIARAGVSQYAASKHALKALADSLRDEVHADGVRVVSVYPGRTATRMQASVRRMEGLPFEPERCLAPEDVAALVIGALTMPERAEVKDISVRPMRE